MIWKQSTLVGCLYILWIHKMKTKIIQLATNLAQKYGLNAFSYSDLAKEIGIAKASIHHYFPAKNDLAREILIQYSAKFMAQLPSPEQSSEIRLKAYIELFNQVAQTQDKICLCMMYASDFMTISSDTQQQVQDFYQKNETWLAQLFIANNNNIENAQAKSQLLFSQLQGLLVRSRLMHDTKQFHNLAQQIIRLYL